MGKRPKPTFEQLEREYAHLFETCEIRPDKDRLVTSITVKIEKNRSIYEEIASDFGSPIPWFFIGFIHNLESSLDFNKHLHNGDPLAAKTYRFPKGRPDGEPPFTFRESALDALKFKKFDVWEHWSIPGVLFKLEEYNGWGYRMYHPETLSPYLWSGSNHYTRGKYIRDGKYDPEIVSRQIGCAVILRKMVQLKMIRGCAP